MKKARRTKKGIAFSFAEEDIAQIRAGTISDIEAVVFALEPLEIGFITDNQCINDFEMGAVLYDSYTDKVFIFNFSDIDSTLMQGKELELEGLDPSETDRELIKRYDEHVLEESASSVKVEGESQIQIDIEQWALDEIVIDLRSAGMTNINTSLKESQKAENLPDDWFDDYLFTVAFSGKIHCNIEEFKNRTSYVTEIHAKEECPGGASDE